MYMYMCVNQLIYIYYIYTLCVCVCALFVIPGYATLAIGNLSNISSYLNSKYYR